MTILAVDPGHTHSAWVVYDTTTARPVRFGYDENQIFASRLEREEGKDQDWHGADRVVIEMIACYGMPVGREVFETCAWIGKFEWAASVPTERIYRTAIKTHLCGTPRAKDGNVAQAIKDRFGGVNAKGTKKAPGPLYGIIGDVWAALAVAVAWTEIQAGAAAGATA